MHKPDKNVLGYNEEGYNYDNPSLCSSHRLWTAQQIAFLNVTGQFAKCVTLFNRLSLSHSSSLPSNLPPPPLSTIDPQQYIFALLSISHSPAGDGGAKSPSAAIRAAQADSPGSEGKTFLSCSMTSWSCSTVSCSCSMSSPAAHTRTKTHYYTFMSG